MSKWLNFGIAKTEKKKKKKKKSFVDSGVSVGRRLTGEGCGAQEKPVGTFFCSIDAPYCKKWTVYQQTENYKSLVSPDLLNKLSLLQKLFRLTPSIRLLSLFFCHFINFKKETKDLGGNRHHVSRLSLKQSVLCEASIYFFERYYKL